MKEQKLVKIHHYHNLDSLMNSLQEANHKCMEDNFHCCVDVAVEVKIRALNVLGIHTPPATREKLLNINVKRSQNSFTFFRSPSNTHISYQNHYCFKRSTLALLFQLVISSRFSLHPAIPFQVWVAHSNTTTFRFNTDLEVLRSFESRGTRRVQRSLHTMFTYMFDADVARHLAQFLSVHDQYEFLWLTRVFFLHPRSTFTVRCAPDA